MSALPGCPGFPKRRTISVRERGNTHEKLDTDHHGGRGSDCDGGFGLCAGPTGETVGLARQARACGATATRSRTAPTAASGGSTPTRSERPKDLLPATDPYGFAEVVNRYRMAAGLAPLAYDHELSVWAAHNNVKQCSHGLGHHVSPNCNQNCAWNTPDAESVAQAWMESPGHRANMLDTTSSRFGIAFGPGPYWTMNTR